MDQAMVATDVYAAILARADPATLAKHSNAVLQANLQHVQDAVAQLTGAMAHFHEVQKAVKQVAQGKPVCGTTARFDELLESSQSTRQQLADQIGKLISPLTALHTVKPKHEKRKREGKSETEASGSKHLKNASSEKLKAIETNKAVSEAEAKAAGSIEAKIQALLESCQEMNESEQHALTKPTMKRVLYQFHIICERVLGSPFESVVEFAAREPRLSQSVEIIAESIGQNELKLHNAPEVVKLLEVIAKVSTKYESLKKLFASAQTAIDIHVKQSAVFSNDQSDSRQVNRDAACDNVLKLAEETLTLTKEDRNRRLHLVIVDWQAALKHCEFSEKKIDRESTKRMEILAQVAEIIVEMIVERSKPAKQAKKYERFTTALTGARKASPTFGKMAQRAEDCLSAYFSGDIAAARDRTSSARVVSEAAHSIEIPTKATRSSSKKANKPIKLIKKAIEEVDGWDTTVVTADQFDGVMATLKAVMHERSHAKQWDGSADSRIEDCVAKMKEAAMKIKNDHGHKKRWNILNGYSNRLNSLAS